MASYRKEVTNMLITLLGIVVFVLIFIYSWERNDQNNADNAKRKSYGSNSNGFIYKLWMIIAAIMAIILGNDLKKK
jgi:ABC-type thiamin/hydroxymethylpyrimidine transport system permease subunit